MRLRALLAGWLNEVPADLEVDGLCLDSRRVQRGDAFVALAGAREHGLAHARAAIASGAVVVLHDGRAAVPSDLAVPALEVPGLAANLPELCRRMWDDPAAGLALVAVTGTNGKTSIAWLLAQALDGAMIGTLGVGRPGALGAATHTTPDLPELYRALAELRDAGVREVILEASSHALDQGRLAGLAFESTIFTNLGRDHLDYHRTRSAYGDAKVRLFTDYRSARKLINIDDPFGQDLAGRPEIAADCIGYAFDNPAAQVRARSLATTADGLELTLATPAGALTLSSRLIGRVNAWNLLVLAAELGARGFSRDDISRRVAALEPVPGRLQLISGPAGQRVFVDYAHTPDALKAALGSLRELTEQRLICVFGCGGDRDRGKRPRMGRIAEALADQVVLTSDNPRSEEPLRILREIQSGMARPERARVLPERAEAIALAVAGARPGDCVLIAGKGHETTQDLGDRVVEFSDFEAARRALEVAA
ncbi:MAG: UDP-N-acetylmuramoyl-L-alanyl-D-glutamate--2,6-diaminopimelate ligase [Wenzhouxiangellaceae bacterium]|nr:UDP-N-acetylmuramoyl-L-alanyl-D-glutamate--2,6-diaminopimelate ligase [Wenzhouxiangellaceae bacterium]